MTRQRNSTLRWVSVAGLATVALLGISSAFAAEVDLLPPAQQPTPIPNEPASPPPPPSPPVAQPPAAPSPPVAQPPTAVQSPPVQERPPAERDQRVVVRGGLNTRGTVKNRVGLSVNAETTSSHSARLDGGLGIEFQMFQSQRDSAILSFMPIYWVARLRPVLRYPNHYLTARLGFDLLGQEGDDTLAERNYYAIGVGLIRHPERTRSLQIELLYSRDRGSFPGVGISAGFLF